MDGYTGYENCSKRSRMRHTTNGDARTRAYMYRRVRQLLTTLRTQLNLPEKAHLCVVLQAAQHKMHSLVDTKDLWSVKHEIGMNCLASNRSVQGASDLQRGFRTGETYVHANAIFMSQQPSQVDNDCQATSTEYTGASLPAVSTRADGMNVEHVQASKSEQGAGVRCWR